METFSGYVYPNMFTMLVGSPGVGKSIIINPIANMWRKASSLKTAPDTITYAAIIDVLAESIQMKNSSNGPLIYSALLVAASEFASLISSYDQTLLGRLTDIYDGRDRPFNSRTRSGGTVTIENPLLHMLLGVQPKFLNSLLPESAWQQGFMSRMVMVHSSEIHQLTEDQIFTPKTDIIRQIEHQRRIVRKLNALSEMYGELTWDTDARDEYMQWSTTGFRPRPTHPKLETYCTRRNLHTWKLCITIACANNRYNISLDDIRLAKNILFLTEEHMPDCFAEMQQTSDTDSINNIFHWMVMKTAKTGSAIPESALHGFMGQIIPIHQIEPMINWMMSSGAIRVEFNPKLGKCFRPGELFQ